MINSHLKKLFSGVVLLLNLAACSSDTSTLQNYQQQQQTSNTPVITKTPVPVSSIPVKTNPSDIPAKQSSVISQPPSTSPEPLTPSSSPVPEIKKLLPSPSHIVIVVLENHGYEQIIDDSAAPYINQLVNSGSALFTESYGLTHPSQPNYLLLFSGTNQGVTDDTFPTKIPFSTPNIGSFLLSAKKTFAGYSEGLPSVGFTGATSGSYASKHSPWVYWQGTGKNMLPFEVNQPFSNFPLDFNKLPDVSFVIPNLDNDMHNGIFDGIIKTGDKWLKNNLDSYIQWSKTHNSLFILTFDEDNYLHGNNIPTIFIGESVKHGKYSERISHLNILRTLEDIYGLPYAGGSSGALPITSCWK